MSILSSLQQFSFEKVGNAKGILKKLYTDKIELFSCLSVFLYNIVSLII
jgi:hypothetical protein